MLVDHAANVELRLHGSQSQAERSTGRWVRIVKGGVLPGPCRRLAVAAGRWRMGSSRDIPATDAKYVFHDQHRAGKKSPSLGPPSPGARSPASPLSAESGSTPSTLEPAPQRTSRESGPRWARQA